MALRNLSHASLITLTRYFTGPLRPQIVGLPVLAWAPPVLDVLLDEMVALEQDPRVLAADARAEASASDAIFDHLARTIHHICQAWRSLALAEGDTARAVEATMLEHRLLPQGLAIVNWSYLDEAAEADRVDGRLRDDDPARMAAVEIFGTTLAAIVTRWQEAARALGEADRRRTDVEAEVAENRLPAMNRVRRQWMGTITAMRAAAELLSRSQTADIFRKLDEAEARADARVARQRAAGAPLADDSDGVLPLDGADVRGIDDAEPAAPPVAPPAAADDAAPEAPGPLRPNPAINLPIFEPRGGDTDA